LNRALLAPHPFSDLESKLYLLAESSGIALSSGGVDASRKWKASSELMKFFRDHAETVLHALAASSSLVGRPTGHAKKDMVNALSKLRSEWV